MKFFLIIIVTGLFIKGNAQNNDQQDYHEKYKLKIAKTAEEIKIDGVLSEQTWKAADIASGFWQTVYRDDKAAARQTEMRLAYNDQYLFISVISFDTLPYLGATLKRDTRTGESDVIGVLLDPLNQRTNGFLFAVSAFNAQSEDVYSAGGLDKINWTWDNKWLSATKQYNDRWIAEMAIPFTTLRYAADKTEWGINVIRGDKKNAEWSMWTKVPINILWPDFGYFGALVWDASPPQPGKNISLIPYTTGSATANNEQGEKIKTRFNAGFDSKIAISSSMNLDLTVNPDFSQIDVDQQVTNLTRFNIFFPEKRTFFLENADLYADLGYEFIRSFYSRTIGLDANGNPIPILAGERISGNLTKKLLIGVMNMQTLKKNEFTPQNYSAVVLKQQVLKRSGITGYFLNRQAFMSEEQKIKNPLNEYGRNAGIETRFTSNSGKWISFAGLHHSFKEGIDDKNNFISTGAEYSTRKAGIKLHYNEVGTNYYTDMGFIGRINNYDARLDSIIRLGFKQVSAQFDYWIFPSKGNINSHNFGIENLSFFNPNQTLNDHFNRLRYFINFKNTSTLKFRLERQDTRLLYYTKFSDGAPLIPAKYVFSQMNAEYQSDNRKNLSYKLGARAGDFYNGKLSSLTAGINYRRQPWGYFSVNTEYNKLNFPAPYGDAEFFLITAFSEVSFSTSVFWTTFLQYNTQYNNFNINSRFQWRFKPMSDLFVVYTDNYFTAPFMKNKNRAVVFKLNHWMNL